MTGSIDWIYWLDVKDYNNAMVLLCSHKEAYSEIEHYFNKTTYACVDDADRFDSLLGMHLSKHTKFDLIMCPDLNAFLSLFYKRKEEVLKSVYELLSEGGVMVLGYHSGPRIVEKGISYILNGYPHHHQARGINDKRFVRPGKIINRLLDKHKSVLHSNSLFVFPNYKHPWTISDCFLFGTKTRDWNRKSRKNTLFIYLMSFKVIALTLKYWWPHRIELIKKTKYVKQSHI